MKITCLIVMAICLHGCKTTTPYQVSYADYMLMQSLNAQVNSTVQSNQNYLYQRNIQAQQSLDNLLLRQSVDRLGW